MKKNNRYYRCISLLSLMMLSGNMAYATESAMGRYSPGLYASPSVAVIPPAGSYWATAGQYYSGSAGKSTAILTGGKLESGVDTSFYSVSLIGTWVPDIDNTDSPKFSLGIYIPLQYMETSASVNRFERTDDSSVLGDIVLAPTLGWQSGRHNWSTSLRVYFPTGEYDKDSIANIGMNYWTFSPALSYTYLNLESGLDISAAAAVDINTENKDTDYTSGVMGHIDVTAIQNFSSSFGAGVFASALYQLTDDQGYFTEQLDGFKGRSFSVGPILRYTATVNNEAVNFVLSWAPEFHVKNRLEGDSIYLSASGLF